MNDSVHIVDVGTMAYRPAWDLQLQYHEEVLKGAYPRGVIMLVEHPPVVTYGRRVNALQHLLASPQLLQSRGIEVVETDRGGDITFHGPGQLVAYPIINLNDYALNLHAYMRFLEDVVIQTLAHFDIVGERSEGATGVWVNTQPQATPQSLLHLHKICAMGVKLRRWVTFHGLALNVTTDLSFFDFINPCGLSRPVTSLQKLKGNNTPSMTKVKTVMSNCFTQLLAAQLSAIAK